MMWLLLPYLITLLFTYLQTGPLASLGFDGFFPNVMLVGLIFYGNSRNRFTGEMLGLLAGLTFDFLSAAPLGFFTLIYTVIGYIAGSTKGKVYVDPVLTPFLMITAGLLLKVLLEATLTGIMGFPPAPVFSRPDLIRYALTMLYTPLHFAFLKGLDTIVPKKRRGGYQD